MEVVPSLIVAAFTAASAFLISIYLKHIDRQILRNEQMETACEDIDVLLAAQKVNLDELERSLKEIQAVTGVVTDDPVGVGLSGSVIESHYINPDVILATIGPATGDDKPLVARTCPNCGAPVRGDDCEYCGSVFRRELPKVTVPDTDEPRTVRVFDRQEGAWKWVPEVKTKRLPTKYSY